MLCATAQREFGRGEIHEPRASSQRRRRTSEDNRAGAALEHESRGSPRDQKSAETAGAPAALEVLWIGVDDVASDKRARVEDAYSERRFFLCDRK